MSVGVHARAVADVSFRDVTIKILDRGCDEGCEWRHAPEAWAEIWEKSVSWLPASEEEGWLSLARRGLVAGAHVVWGRWYLSPYFEKPLNSKVMKSFVPELRSRKCFFCVSGFLCHHICYIWTFYEYYMYVSHIHVWVCYTHIFMNKDCICTICINWYKHWYSRRLRRKNALPITHFRFASP